MLTLPTRQLNPWRRSKKKHDTTCPVNYSRQSKNTYLTEKKVRNDLAKNKDGLRHAKVAANVPWGAWACTARWSQWPLLVQSVGRSVGRLASASRPHLLIEDALLLGLRFGPLTTFLAALLACLLTCVRVAWFTPPVKASRRRRGRGGRLRRRRQRPRGGLPG